MSDSLENHLIALIGEQLVFNTNALQKGDIIAVQGGNKIALIAQKLTDISSDFDRTCHVALVVDVNETELSLLESLYSSNAEENGVNVNIYDPGQYYALHGQAIYVLRNTDLQPQMEKVVDQFAQNYPKGNCKTKYGTSHLLSAFCLLKNDTTNGRLRTLYSRVAGEFMTAHGKPRKSITCPAVVVDIVKIAQINLAIQDSPEEEKILSDLSEPSKAVEQLIILQKNRKVANLTSKRALPGRLIQELTLKYNLDYQITNAVIPLKIDSFS